MEEERGREGKSEEEGKMWMREKVVEEGKGGRNRNEKKGVR